MPAVSLASPFEILEISFSLGLRKESRLMYSGTFSLRGELKRTILKLVGSCLSCSRHFETLEF
uniref:Uncharacterized protein n=1 Tax=Arundo donax TaxID=35708 RepID=A0A0A9E9R9_ARUDO